MKLDFYLIFLLLLTQLVIAEKLVIEPNQAYVENGTTFSVYIKVINVSQEPERNLRAFDIAIEYNPNVLEFVLFRPGSFLGSDIYTLSPAESQPGTVSTIAATMIGLGAKYGTGILANLTFKAKASGNSIIEIINNSLVSEELVLRSSPTESGEIIVCEGSDCENYELYGQPTCQPQPEICDGIDNDCDGLIDENLAPDPQIHRNCPSTCFNGALDGNEVGVDCGGVCESCMTYPYVSIEARNIEINDVFSPYIFNITLKNEGQESARIKVELYELNMSSYVTIPGGESTQASFTIPIIKENDIQNGYLSFDLAYLTVITKINRTEISRKRVSVNFQPAEFDAKTSKTDQTIVFTYFIDNRGKASGDASMLVSFKRNGNIVYTKEFNVSLQENRPILGTVEVNKNFVLSGNYDVVIEATAGLTFLGQKNFTMFISPTEISRESPMLLILFILIIIGAIVFFLYRRKKQQQEEERILSELATKCVYL